MTTSDPTTAERVNEDAWREYGRRQLDRGCQPPEVTEIDWGSWGTDPGTHVLGDVAGYRVLDLGSGAGVHAAHLARDHTAFVDAIHISPTQQQRARDADNPVVYQLIQARRLPHTDVPSVVAQERSLRPPLPQAALGVGIIVTSPDGPHADGATPPGHPRVARRQRGRMRRCRRVHRDRCDP